MLLDSPIQAVDGEGPEGWTMDIAGWLGSLSLTRYESLFREREIDGQSIGALTEDDLAKLGIPVRDRRRLLRAIEALNARAPGLHPAKASAALAFHEVALAAQRRQLTVMFCDLVGSTELAGRLDPEDLDDLTRAYHRCCAEHIERAGGYVAKYMGDGVLAYFGYPQAHEDDAERAVHAALNVSAAVARLPSPTGLPLATRIGIATGLVVVGEVTGAGASEERSVAGVTPNLAARLQAAAPPDGVVVSDATRRLATGLFDFRDMGALALKGFDAGEAAWQVVGAKAAPDRFRARHDHEPADLVGRDPELQLILDRYRRCAAGEGQVVGLAGEPGIGKSRLIHEVRKALAQVPHQWLEGGGAQVFRNSPFYTISQMVRRGLVGGATLTPDACLAALAQSLTAAAVRTEHALPLIAELIGVPTPDSQAPLTLSPDQRRTGLIAAVLEWLANSAAVQPTVLVIEDLHWVDPSSMELLDQLVEKVGGARLLLLYSTRIPEGAPWTRGPNHALCRLDRLDADSLRQLVLSASGRELPVGVLENVVSRAEGVPLFAEELTRLLLDQPEAIRGREIPATLSDLLMARLDQLGPAKEISQIASVLGAEFQLPLLAAVAGRPEAEVAEAIAALAAADLVVPRGPAGHGLYAFRHALIQDAAYQALLRRQRRLLHRRAAVAITEQFPDLAAHRPELLGQHWAAAGEPQRSVAVWKDVCLAARGRRAFKEALHAAQQALDSLAAMPAADRQDLELELQSLLTEALQLTAGYAAPPTTAAMDRLRELAALKGSLPQQMQRAFGEWAAFSSNGAYRASRKAADQFLQLAQIDGAPASLGQARSFLMTSQYRMGELLTAEQSYRDGLADFATAAFRRSPGGLALVFGNAAIIAWLMGDLAESRRRIARALSLSEEGGSAYDLAFSQQMAAMLAGLWEEPGKAAAFAEAAIALSEAHGFSQFVSTSRVALGRAKALMGSPAEGAALMLEGMAQMGERRARAGITIDVTWLAEALAQQGSIEPAILRLDQTIDTNPEELFFRPEVLRVRGDLRLALADLRSAEADYRQALALARTIGAEHLFRRAASSLTMFRRQQTL